ncbi:hypothetical protein TNIN_98211 [Trichonephila inaurata madagascariensis]|uniref:C2H2-type domain-containing protein n=1 Tax=Trichonephila inaurata madagascariensis TaxID=2747483 RepID=A0A8X6IAC2_9ARAC|nr:hypothetical protein TNIN_98211 [Trichonephila inaurata madagascariensis]
MDFILDTEVPLPEDLAVIHSFSSPELSDIEKPTNILNLENLLNVVNETVETSEMKSLAVNEELNLPSTITPCIALLKDNFFVELHNFESINNLSSNGTMNDVALSRNIMPMNSEENFQTESINFYTNNVSASDFGVIQTDESSKLQFENPSMVEINYSKRKSFNEENIQCASGEMLISMFNGYEMKELNEQKVIRFTGACIQDALDEKDLNVNEMEGHQTTNIMQIPEYDVYQHLNVQRKESAMLSLVNCPLQNFSKNIAFVEQNRGEKLESNNNFIANEIDFHDNCERKSEKSVELDEIKDNQKRNMDEIQDINNHVDSIHVLLSDSQFKKTCLIDKDHSSTNEVPPTDFNNSKNYLNSIKIINESNPLKIKPCKVLVKKLEPHRKKRSAFLHQTSKSNDSNYYNLSKDANSSTEYKRIPVIRLSRIRKKNMKGKKQNYKLKEKTRKKISKSQKHSLESDASLYSRQKESLMAYIHLYNSQSNYDPEMDVNIKKFKAKNFHTKTRNLKKRIKGDCNQNAEYHKTQKVEFNGDGELLRKKVIKAENIIKRHTETNSDSAIKISGNDIEQISDVSESKLLQHLPKQKRKHKESYMTITKPPKNLSKNIGKRSKVQVLKSNPYSFVNWDIMNGSEKNKLNEQVMEFNETSTKMLKEKELLNNHEHHSVFPEKTVKCKKFLDCDDKFACGKTTFHTNLSEFTSDVRSKITFNENNPLSVIKPCRIMLKKLEHHICKTYLRESNSSLCKTSSETNTFPMFDNMQHNVDKHKTFCQRKLKNFKTKSRKKLYTVVKKRSKKDVIARLKEKSRKKSNSKTKKDAILRKNEKVYICCKEGGSLTFDDKREFLNNQSENSLHETGFIENMNLESNDKQKSFKIAIKGNNAIKIVDGMNTLNEKSEESPIFSDHKVLRNNDLGECNHEAKLTEQKQESNSKESYSKITIEGTKTNKISMSEINLKCEVDSDDCSDHSDNSEWYEVVSDTDENEVSDENDTDLKESEVDENLIGEKKDKIQIPNILHSVTFELNDNESRETTSLASIMHCSLEKELSKESPKYTDSTKRNKKRIYNSDLNDCAFENDSNRSSENGVEKQVLISDKISFEKLKESKINVFPNDPLQNIAEELSAGNSERKEIENNTEFLDSSQIKLPQISRKCKKILKKMETQNAKNMQNLTKLHADLHQGSQIPDNKHFDANEDPVSIDSGDILMPNITENLSAGFKKNKFKECPCNGRKKWSLSNKKCAKLHKSKFTTGPDENSFSVKMKYKWKYGSNSNTNDTNQTFENEYVMEILGNGMNGLEIDGKKKCLDDKIENEVDLLSSSVNCNESSRNRPSNFVLNPLDYSFVTKQCSVLLDRLDSEIVKIYTMNQKFLLQLNSQSYRNNYSRLDEFKDSEILSKSFSPAKFGKRLVPKKHLGIKKSFKKQNTLSERKINNTKFTRKCNLRTRVNHNHTEVKKSELIESCRKGTKEQRKRGQIKREKTKMRVIVNEANSFRKAAQRNYLKKLKFLFPLKSCRVLVQRCDSSSFSKNLGGNFNEINQKLQIDNTMFDSTDSEDDVPFNSKFTDVSDSKFYPTSYSKYCEISDSECSNLSGKLSAASNAFTDCVDDGSYFRKTPYRMRKKSNEDHLTDDENQVSNKKEFKNLSCNLCDKSFITYTSFLNHERKFHRNKAYKCVLCNRSFKPRAIYTEINDEPYKLEPHLSKELEMIPHFGFYVL